MATNDYDVSVEKQKLLDSWNPPPEDHSLELLVGVPPEPGSVAATATVPMEEHNKHITPGASEVDAQRLQEFIDDGDDGEAEKDLDDMDKAELKDAAERRGLAKSGSKGDLKDRIREHDAAQTGDDEDDEDDES